MEPWIPFLQTLVWPIFLTGLLIAFRRQFRAVVDEIAKRIGRGDNFEAGPSGVKVSATPPRPIDQDELYERVSAAVSDALHSGIAADIPKEKLEGIERKVDQQIRERAFLAIDAKPLLGPAGGEWQVSYYQYRTVSALLDDIWATVRILPSLSFGRMWVLEANGRRLTDQEIGRSWAATHGKTIDDRPLDHPDVGIKPGMKLKIVPVGAWA